MLVMSVTAVFISLSDVDDSKFCLRIVIAFVIYLLFRTAVPLKLAWGLA